MICLIQLCIFLKFHHFKNANQLYFIGSLVGGVSHILFTEETNTDGIIGASGSIYTMAGFSLTTGLLPMGKLFVIGLLIYELSQLKKRETSNISNVAHITSLITGILYRIIKLKI
eukprot:gene9379-1590_t